MKMKLVKFENGTYGVRKWSWLLLAYVFADDSYTHWHENSFSGRHWIEFSKEKAEAILLARLNPPPKKDNGKPVKKKTHIPPLGRAQCLCCRK